MNVFYADHFIEKDELCELENELIAECKKHRRRSLCLNESPGRDDCITGDEGIVYVRIYSYIVKAQTIEYASYKTVRGVTVPVLKHELKEKINDAIENNKHYYIGVARTSGTPIQSMCQREESECERDAKSCDQPTCHHADKKSKRKRSNSRECFLRR